MFDDYMQHVLSLIDRHGWAIQHVGGGDQPDEPSFSYTVGLTTMGHPEFILFGLAPRSAGSLLNVLGDQVQKGHRYRANTLTSDPEGTAAPVALIEVIDPPKYLFVATDLYPQVEALQVIWPDSRGRLPWDDGYPNPLAAQPLLGPLPDRFERV
jgi:Domain of unknown function (DUF4262)